MSGNALAVSRQSAKGSVNPRMAPPVPARSLIAEYRDAAALLGIKLMPWQVIAARYLTAQGRRGRWLYREVAVVAPRQNGKTTLLLPRVRMALARGERVLHTAQNRDIPRKAFTRELVPYIARDASLEASIRMANGQEEINVPGGGRYKIVAPNASSRGETADLVIIDEVREQVDLDLIDAMLPTVTATGGQVLYLSNAGTDASVVLNDLRRRGLEGARGLAYLEWSAAPERDIDDRAGWAEANPALGYSGLTWDTLEHFRQSRPPASFEVEHLCRWATDTAPRLVTEAAWQKTRGQTEAPANAQLAVKLDPSGKRCSAALAWLQSDGRVALEVVLDEQGDPVDVQDIGPRLYALRARTKARQVALDDWTDKELAKYLKGARAVNGREYANASENFARLIDGGRLIWANAEQVGADLAWAGRRNNEQGAWQAVQLTDEHSITALLAAIRAVWLASGPRPPAPRIR